MCRVLFTLLCCVLITAAPKKLRGSWLEVEIGSNTFQVTDYGAKGDGKTLDTDAIQKAFDAAGKAGGTVSFPGPLSDSGAIERKYLATEFHFSGDKTAMLVPHGVRILFSNDRSLYKNTTDLITIKGFSNIAFSGGGIIDGQGSDWWKCRIDNCFRPRLLSVSHTSHLLMQDITWKDSPNHVLEMYSDFTEMSGVNVFAPPSTSSTIAVNGTYGPSHNTDAVDVHGSPFYIHHCHFDTGDDNIAAHANDTLVEDCVFGHGHGASIGSIGTAHLSNITFRNIVFNNTGQAVKIKTDSGGSGYVRNITWENLVLHNVEESIQINMFYNGGKNASTKLKLYNINIKNLTAYGTKTEDGKTISAGSFQCQATSPCHEIHLSDVTHPDLEALLASEAMQGKSSSSTGFVCSEAYGTADHVTPKSCLLSEGGPTPAPPGPSPPTPSPPGPSPAGCDPDACISRCVAKYGGKVSDQGPAYSCAKGCAGVSGGKVTSKGKFCKLPAATREASCDKDCTSSSSKPERQQECTYGCEYWKAGR
jgi:hypothetical protein